MPALAEMNAALIRDERADTVLDASQLEDRMRGWLGGDYTAILFEDDGGPIGYGLYRADQKGVHLRQFFIESDRRRQGHGRHALELLRSEVWPADTTVTLEVLTHNRDGRAFWEALGFRERAVVLESGDV